MAVYTITEINHVGSLCVGGGRSLARASDGRLWVVFSHTPIGYAFKQIHSAYSDDSGVTWTVEQVTFNDTVDYLCPSIAIDSANAVHIVYHRLEGAPYALYHMERNGTWGAEEAVSEIAGAGQRDGVIAIDSGNDIHVVWTGGGEGGNPAVPQIKYKEKPAGGGWGLVEHITDVVDRQYLASIAIGSDDSVHVVWYGRGWEGRPERNIRYRKRTAAWQAPEAITDTDQSQYQPQIALDSNDVPHVVWEGIGVLFPVGAHAIDYKNRIGGVWSALTVLAEDPFMNDQERASIAIDSEDTVHVAWAGRGLGLLVGVYNVRYRKRVGVAWQPLINVTTEGVFDQFSTCLLWAMHPTVSGVKTNIPKTGAALVWEDDTPGVGPISGNLKFYPSADLFWVTPPTVTTDPATNVLQTFATPNGSLVNDGGEACACGFEWGPTVAYGNTSPTQSKNTGETFSQILSGLTPGATYHFRAFATNSAGTSYGADRSFTTLHTLQLLVVSKAYALAREEL